MEIEGWRSVERRREGGGGAVAVLVVGVGRESAEKNTPANKSQTLPHTPRTACGTGQFFNGSGRA